LGLTCFVCDKEILDSEDSYMVAIEIPYGNLFMHRNEYKQIESTLSEYLTERIEKVYSYINGKTKKS
jgi:hypothetical protein